MATIKSVRQALELAKNLVTDIGTDTVTNADKERMLTLATEVLELCKAVRSPEKFEHPLLPLPSQPVDVLLKKGKVELTEGRYKQLVQIYDELQVMGVKFLGAKQNQHVTWLPLVLKGDKSAALFLGAGGEWLIEPLSIKANGELTGEWEGFDLTEFMSMNCPDFDQDEY